jgi:hypothetical protein
MNTVVAGVSPGARGDRALPAVGGEVVVDSEKNLGTLVIGRGSAFNACECQLTGAAVVLPVVQWCWKSTAHKFGFAVFIRRRFILQRISQLIRSI